MTADDPRPVPLAELTGVVVRTLLVGADGTRDTTTAVTWLQGPSLYVDLRRPPGRPAVPDPADEETLAWARAHQGFAGRCTQTADGVTHWQRAVDLHVPGPFPDAGRLVRDGHEVVEHGVHEAYLERWHPEPVPPGTHVAGALLAGRADGRPGVLVRVGARFGYARGRGPDDDPGDRLAALVALGRVTPRGWVVETASLPWWEGADLAPHRDGTGLLTAGPSAPSAWAVAEAEASPGHDPLSLLTVADHAHAG